MRARKGVLPKTPGELRVGAALNQRRIHERDGIEGFEVMVAEQVLSHHAEFPSLRKFPGQLRIEARVRSDLLEWQGANEVGVSVLGQSVGEFHVGP